MTTLDFWDAVVEHATSGLRVDYLICDEVQFYTPVQVEQLARLVDEMGIDVFAFGITADFRTQLFPGSRRMIELADKVQVLQVEALCWCGKRATHNARVVDGVMVVEGEQVVVGDTKPGSESLVEYEVLCRRHFMRRMNSAAARAASDSPDVLPFDLDLCPVPQPVAPTESAERSSRRPLESVAGLAPNMTSSQLGTLRRPDFFAGRGGSPRARRPGRRSRLRAHVLVQVVGDVLDRGQAPRGGSAELARPERAAARGRVGTPARQADGSGRRRARERCPRPGAGSSVAASSR